MQEYPHPEEIKEYGIALDEREYEILEEYELSAQVGDKLGGWLSWAQYIEYPNCPTCNREMNQFIFQFESDSDENFTLSASWLGSRLSCAMSRAQRASHFFLPIHLNT